MQDSASVGVIGGSGFYELLENAREVRIDTPFGAPSDSYFLGDIDGVPVAFLPRHARGHRILPGEVNYRANIWGMKSLGVKHVLSASAVGSLREELKPLDVVVPDQLFDRTKARPSTFFGDGVIQTENGGIGVGPAPEPGCEDRDRANAGNQPITLVPGGSYFDSATSFAMIRGGHIDATFLGTLQVDEKGNIANWIVPGKMLAGMGGAMDLITGAKIVYIVSEHCSKDGASKLMKLCTFPLTGAEEADVIITERALFRRHPDTGWVLEEVATGFSLDDIAGCTDMAYAVAADVKLDAFGA